MQVDASDPAATPAAEVAPERIGRRGWAALALVAASYVTILDNISVSVAFPAIERAFPTVPRSTLAWVSSGYAVALAAFLLLAGRLGDRIGRRRLYRLGMVGFACGALASAVAPNPAVLIAARTLEGAAGAALIAPAIALGLPLIPASRRGMAMGWLGVAGSFASLAGPVIAGNLLAFTSWRMVFCIAPPICALAWWAAPRVFDEQVAADIGALDVVGALTATSSVAVLTLAITQSGRLGWADPFVLGAFAAAGGLFAVFIRQCLRHPSPLVRLSVLRRRSFSVATASQLFTQLAIFAWFFCTPLFLQNVWGWTAAGSAWIIAIAMGLSINSAPVGAFADRNGYREVLVIGGLFVAAGLGLWLLQVGEQPSFWSLLPGLLLLGWGMGMVGMTSTAAALHGIPADELAMANAAHQTSRRLMQTLGTAVAVAVLGDRSADSLARFRALWVLIGVCYLISAVIAVAYPTPGRTAVAPASRPNRPVG